MSQTAFSGSLQAGGAVGAHPSSLPLQEFGAGTRGQQLESKFAELQRQYADLHAGVFEAGQVYRRLCAPRIIRHGNFEIASETFAARHVPGDFITIQERADSVLLALGDISGKGLAAGMWTTLLMGLLGIHSESVTDPEKIIAAVNRDLCRVPFEAPLASLFLGRLDSTTGRLDYCSAGHPPALLLGEVGNLELLSDGGTLLGVSSGASFVKGSVELRDWTTLVAYSDGVLEAHNDEQEEFGFDRLEAHLRLARSTYADGVLFSVLGAVQDFVAGHPQADDMSLVVVRRRVSEAKADVVVRAGQGSRLDSVESNSVSSLKAFPSASIHCPELRNEIGVLRGVRKILVPVEREVRAKGARIEQTDFEMMFDERVDGKQLWIEVAPPNRSIALLLNKRPAANPDLQISDPLGAYPVYLNCEDFHRTYNELIDRGANFLGEPAKLPFGWLSMFEDAEGRRFVLGQW